MFLICPVHLKVIQGVHLIRCYQIMAPRGGYKTIVENEEKDSYFYLRKYGGGESSWFEGVIVHTPEGVKEYTHLTCDVEGVIGPLVRKGD